MIARVRRRWLLRTRLRSAGIALGAAALPVVGAVAAVRAFDMGGEPLLGLLSAAAIVAAVAAGLSLRRMPRRPTDREVARFVEERLAETGDASLEDHLVSAVDAAPRPGARHRTASAIWS